MASKSAQCSGNNVTTNFVSSGVISSSLKRSKHGLGVSSPKKIMKSKDRKSIVRLSNRQPSVYYTSSYRRLLIIIFFTAKNVLSIR